MNQQKSNIDPPEFPSEHGQSRFQVFIKPISSQASRVQKDQVTSAIRQITKKIDKIITTDVSVTITWFVNEDERYELDSSADIDNIIKPILDALSGPDGIILNDCQVQHLSCNWRDRYGDPEHIVIEISYEPDAFFEKDKIIFVQVRGALCMPIHEGMVDGALKILLDDFEMKLWARDKLMEMSNTYHQARSVMSIQRYFHRTRVGDFKVKKIEELRVLL
jgi:Holliday junction resolvase RusA-like endonuclease